MAYGYGGRLLDARRVLWAIVLGLMRATPVALNARSRVCKRNLRLRGATRGAIGPLRLQAQHHYTGHFPSPRLSLLSPHE